MEHKSVINSDGMAANVGSSQIDPHLSDQQVCSNNRKKLTVILLCLAVCAALIFALTRTQYKTPEMRSKVVYEPALFNTVLLGQLVSEDVTAVNAAASIDQTYTIASKDATDGSYTQKVTGKKLSTSLNVSESTELGNKQQTSNTSFAKVSPGKTYNAYVPFTITNGTTVADDTANENKTKNVAESDIRYTINIVTTENLPLSYQLQDVNTNRTYALEEKMSDDGTMGNSKNYTVSDTVSSGSSASNTDGVFHAGSRILKCNDDGSITVHQYKLLVSWPPQTTGTDGTQANNDLNYMKELENVEIRVEVESYVNYVNKTDATADDNKAEGVMVLQGSPVSDAYYSAGAISEKLYAQKTVRYDNLTELSTTGTGNKKLPDSISTKTGTNKVLGYIFHVCNGDSVSAQWTWNADTNEETSPTRKENGHDPKDGHYTYSGTYQSGTYKVAVAVPSNPKSGVSAEDRTDMTYYLEYNGTVYTGIADDTQSGTSQNTASQSEDAQDTGSSPFANLWKTFTSKWTKSKDETTGKISYEAKDTEAYQILRFYDDNNNEFTLDEFNNSGFQNEEVRLYAASASGYTYRSSKDDFRIYVYK